MPILTTTTTKSGTTLTAWPDVEAVLMDLLGDLVTAKGTETPADFTNLTPFLRVNRFGGSDDRVTDRATVAVDIFASLRSDAYTTAEAVRQRLLAGPHVLDGAVIDYVTTVSGPAEAPWANTAIRRWSATYRVSARRLTS